MNATTVASINFKKKITVIFSDGIRKQNLNLDSAIALVQSQPTVNVVVSSEEPKATELFNSFMKLTGAVMTSKPGEVSFVKETEPVAAKAQIAAANLAPELVDEVTEGLAENETLAPELVEELTEPAAEAKTEEKPAEPKQAVGYIILGPKDVYTDAAVALADIQRGPFVEAPAKYNNKITKTFLSGSPEGQIKSMFHDYKSYGPAVAPKLKEFATFVLNTNHDNAYSKYVQMFKAGLLPHNPVTFAGNRVDMSFFKLYALLTVAAGM